MIRFQGRQVQGIQVSVYFHAPVATITINSIAEKWHMLAGCARAAFKSNYQIRLNTFYDSLCTMKQSVAVGTDNFRAKGKMQNLQVFGCKHRWKDSPDNNGAEAKEGKPSRGCS
jgi:hypothetical protein